MSSFSAAPPRPRITFSSDCPPPAALDDKSRPPTDFIPCKIRDRLGKNFTNHVDFTRNGNKWYWVLFWPPHEAGMFSLKPEAERAASTGSMFPWLLECQSGWRQVWNAWAHHCWERHAKCETHPNACVHGDCPSHPEPDNPEVVRVASPVIKAEGQSRRIKRETPSRARRCPTAPLSDDEQPAPGMRPLYDSDSDPEEGSGPPALSSVSSLSASTAAGAGTVPSSAAPSTASSLSASTTMSIPGASAPSAAGPSVSAPSAAGLSAPLGPLASVSMGGSGMSVGSAARAARRYDAFYVGWNGAIYHSRTEAFEDVEEGPVQVVVGWEEAAEVALQRAIRRSAKNGKERADGMGMDVDR
ncbi:hypothetical protein C8R46DRAFT_1208292 [Mycena filopes]|nr:hypothetical protein C8R46DRAFT_1208292 [Mycena filopes]